VDIDEKQDVEGFQTYRLDGEQVTSDDRYRLGLHELAPGVTFGTTLSLWGNDSADARSRDLDAQLEQLTLDALVGFSLGATRGAESVRHRPLWIHSMRLGPFPPDEPSMPAAQRIWHHQRRGVFP
jgi:hypothetical protein